MVQRAVRLSPQWVAQSLNTLSQLVFMLAARRLWLAQDDTLDDAAAGAELPSRAR